MSILEMKKRKDGVKSGASSLLTVICALLVEIIFFSWRSPYFLNLRNFLNIGLYAAIVGCISCSVTFINISGNIDLSVGSQIAVVGMVAAIVSGPPTTG